MPLSFHSHQCSSIKTIDTFQSYSYVSKPQSSYQSTGRHHSKFLPHQSIVPVNNRLCRTHCLFVCQHRPDAAPSSRPTGNPLLPFRDFSSSSSFRINTKYWSTNCNSNHGSRLDATSKNPSFLPSFSLLFHLNPHIIFYHQQGIL